MIVTFVDSLFPSPSFSLPVSIPFSLSFRHNIDIAWLPRMSMNRRTLLFAAAGRKAHLEGAEFLCRLLVARKVNIGSRDFGCKSPRAEITAGAYHK